MKIFFHKIVLFVVLGIINFFLLYLVITFFYWKRIDTVTLGNETQTVICGDSHTQCAINDSIFFNSVNFSQNSEHNLYTYNFLCMLLENNPHIENIILGFSFHNLSLFYDKYLFDNEKTADKYPRYFSILRNTDKEFLLKNNLYGVVKSSHGIIRTMFNSITDNCSDYHDYPFCGSYYPSSRSNFSDSMVNAAIKRHYYTGEDVSRVSDLQISFLKEIASLCKEKKVNLIILSTPVHKNYFEKIPKRFIEDYYSLIQDICTNTSVKFFDYHDYQLPVNCFGDGDHLNKSGASIFTVEIMNRIIF